ncbi:MAG TPA: DUF262 domain-containing protein [Candidatus Sulfotelmatobacter sp.]|nr:DUF262 domain-containing protein [Candidatus Sulfotelmatobacter sp.]
MATLIHELDQRSSEIRFEVIDFSAGELIRLHQDHEVNIQPAFQRMFRWTQEQQSRLIESMLLGLPIPQIVLFQREDGVLELIDGLQRVSSIIRFITGKTPHEAEDEQEQTTELVGCDIVPSLNGKLFADLEAVLQLELKRKTIRAIVIRRTNDPNLRYEMFKRLNAGGSPAEAHEVRNASLRIVGASGEAFLKFLDECCKRPFFEELTDTLSEQAKQRLGSQELVLRFFALKNSMNTYKGSISDWLDDYSEAVAKKSIAFNYDLEGPLFDSFFELLASKLGSEAFVKHKNRRALGGLAPAYFDAVTMGVLPLKDRLARVSTEKAKQILNLAVGHENDTFRQNVGPGANAAPRLRARIDEVRRVFGEKLPK